MSMQRSKTLNATAGYVWRLDGYGSDAHRAHVDKQISTTKSSGKQAFIDISEVNRSFSNTAVGQPLNRFYFRSAVGVLGPIIVSAYFIAIWRIYLTLVDVQGPLAFGSPGATWVFYSWFAAGVVGLNFNLYGLAGVEAAMLMEPAWNKNTLDARIPAQGIIDTPARFDCPQHAFLERVSAVLPKDDGISRTFMIA
ncbi:hypothetical protein BU25DRAFT_460571 [Macroventuria anomochaeta]|uniref:Uncharacterized protein n=1 Tax=Macroventuria anomochaeta TaxID=301207 RepID=A0ACB6RT39_9PLEO|nr:uncharacterized protein BU25DRAFT_460571 [Macroventuria anomochaeta]KAF2625091.1 hypothetical protein BU25DRAFT_460571 [Macroventuria anomochaeta]